MDFQIPLDEAKELPFDKYIKDFTFIVNGTIYETSRVLADLISPKIRKLQYIDSTINYFNFETANKNFDFSSFLISCTFNKIRLSPEQVPDFLEVCSKIGNERLYLSLYQELREEITNQNVFNRIEIKNHFLREFDKDTEDNEASNADFLKKEYDYIAAHFSDFPTAQLSKLSEQTLLGVMASDQMRVEAEDSLLQFLIEEYEKDHKKSYLFELIDYRNVSPHVLFDFMNQVDVAHLNSRVWRSLSTKFYESDHESDSKLNPFESTSSRPFITQYVRRPKRFDLSKGNGVFSFLQSKFGNQLLEDRIIAIQSNAAPEILEKVFNFDNQNGNKFNTPNEPNSYITFDFRNFTLRVTSYDITSCNWSENSNHMKNWVVETSSDGNNFTTIDVQKDCTFLNNNNCHHKFPVETQTFVKYIRIKSTGLDWHRQNFLAFNKIEFFGILESPQNLNQQ